MFHHMLLRTHFKNNTQKTQRRKKQYIRKKNTIETYALQKHYTNAPKNGKTIHRTDNRHPEK